MVVKVEEEDEVEVEEVEVQRSGVLEAAASAHAQMLEPSTIIIACT